MSIKVNGKIVAGRGADGKSAYQAAVDAGYTGTETEFNEALSKIDEVPTDAYTKTEADQKFATQASVTSVSSKVDNLQTVVNQQQEMIIELSDNVTSATQKVGELETDVTEMQGQLADFATTEALNAVKSTAESAQSTAQTASTAASSANSKATAAQNTANSAQQTATAVSDNVTTHVIPDLNENSSDLDLLGEVFQNKPWNRTENSALTSRISGDTRVGMAHWYWERGAGIYRGNGWFFMNLSPIQSFQNPNTAESGGFTYAVFTTTDKFANGDTITIVLPDCMATAFEKMQRNCTFMDRDGNAINGNTSYQTGTTGANPRISFTANAAATAPGLVFRYAPVNSEDV